MMYSSFKLIFISKNRKQVKFLGVVSLLCFFEDISISITPINLSCKITCVQKFIILIPQNILGWGRTNRKNPVYRQKLKIYLSISFILIEPIDHKEFDTISKIQINRTILSMEKYMSYFGHMMSKSWLTYILILY